MTAAMVALTMSIINLTLWSVVLVAAARDWQHFHDERAARGALLALVLIAAAIGGVVSALGYFINVTTGGTSDTLAIAAGIARGAMIVGGFAYVASLNRHKPNGPRGRKDD
jgi:FtsH-binding integral membrane protein